MLQKKSEMRKIIIHKPIWNLRAVGIAEHKINDGCLIEIDYIDREGNRLYPDVYYLGWEKAMKCPVQFVKGNRLRIVKIEELEVLK